MTIEAFDVFIEVAKEDFLTILEQGYSNTNREKDNLNRVLKNWIDQCSSDFEVNILKESLQEVFSNYLSSLN